MNSVHIESEGLSEIELTRLGVLEVAFPERSVRRAAGRVALPIPKRLVR